MLNKNTDELLEKTELLNLIENFTGIKSKDFDEALQNHSISKIFSNPALIEDIDSSKYFKMLKLIKFRNLSNNYQKFEEMDTINLSTPTLVAEYLNSNFLQSNQKESFYCLYLDVRSNLIDTFKIDGKDDKVMLDIIEIFKRAVLCNSKKIILAHNHPSYNLEPSKNDIVSTKELIKAGESLNIEILDHLILNGKEFISFRRENIVKFENVYDVNRMHEGKNEYELEL